MPASLMTLFPQMQASLNGASSFLQTSLALTGTQRELCVRGGEVMRGLGDMQKDLLGTCSCFLPHRNREAFNGFLHLFQDAWERFEALSGEFVDQHIQTLHDRGKADDAFLSLFTKDPEPQGWSFDVTEANTILDLPGMRLIDVSTADEHKIANYAVVFSPRAGHHSNIAERVALYLRSQGLTRMAIVEQKCADHIPLTVDGRRHYENFDGQIEQYTAILKHLKQKTGRAPHLIAICQPGPLLISTLMLHPELGRTFGSAGSPMDTEGEPGFLGDYSRAVGEQYIDWLLQMFPCKVPEGLPGAGRTYYDGRLQVLGFYLLGINQHWQNFQRLLGDLRAGALEAASRQIEFYNWYNFVYHAPRGFIRDTYKRVFVRNELAHGTFAAEGRTIGFKDYPATVPIWALSGTRDDITPPGVAAGHMAAIKSVPSKDRLELICDAGHMGIFRSSKVLREQYSRVAQFLLEHSDRQTG